MKYLFVTIVSILSQTTWAQTTPNPSEVYIKNISAHGSGCPSGSVRSVLSPDGKTMSVLFDNYISEIDTSLRILEQKNCQLTIEMNIPVGWSYSLASADYRGFAELDPNTMAVQEILYTFGSLIESRPTPVAGRSVSVSSLKGRIPTRTRTATFSSRILKGPFSGDYSFNNLVTVGEMPWSSCDSRAVRDLKIHTSLLARSLTRGPTKLPGTAMITLDTIDGTVAQSFDMAWKKCP